MLVTNALRFPANKHDFLNEFTFYLHLSIGQILLIYFEYVLLSLRDIEITLPLA